MTEDGCVILDNESRPILAFTDLPDTISSKAEAAFLVAWRRSNRHIHMRDIRARMPDDPTGENPGRDPIRLGTLGMRMTRFREVSGMISWDKAHGSEALKSYLDENLPLLCTILNSIKGHRDLYPHEIAEMALVGVGQSPERSRHGKDFSALKKTMAYDMALAKYQRLKAKFDKDNRGQNNRDVESRKDSTDSGSDVHASNSVDDREKEGTEEGDGNLNEGSADTLYPASSQVINDEVGLAEEEDLGRATSFEEAWELSAESQLGIDENTESALGEEQGLAAEEYTTGDLEEPTMDAVSDHETWFLYAVGDTEAHQLLVFYLLEPTRGEYRTLTSQDAPPTNPALSYVDQWATIQRAFSHSYVTPGHQQEVTYLISVVACSRLRIVWSKTPLGIEIDFDDLVEAVFE